MSTGTPGRTASRGVPSVREDASAGVAKDDARFRQLQLADVAAQTRHRRSHECGARAGLETDGERLALAGGPAIDEHERAGGIGERASRRDSFGDGIRSLPRATRRPDDPGRFVGHEPAEQGTRHVPANPPNASPASRESGRACPRDTASRRRNAGRGRPLPGCSSGEGSRGCGPRRSCARRAEPCRPAAGPGARSRDGERGPPNSRRLRAFPPRVPRAGGAVPSRARADRPAARRAATRERPSPRPSCRSRRRACPERLPTRRPRCRREPRRSRPARRSTRPRGPSPPAPGAGIAEGERRGSRARRSTRR